MANPLPNEEECYRRIRDERIRVAPCIWEAIDDHLDDPISLIDLVAALYTDRNTPMPVKDALLILGQTLRIREAMQKILNPAAILDTDERFLRVKRERPFIAPVVRDLFTHYIGNDTHIINMCVSFYTDPADPVPVPVEDARKILKAALSMRVFLCRLREASCGATGEAR